MADTRAPERIVTNALAMNQMLVDNDRNAINFQNQQEDRQTRNALAMRSSQMQEQKNSIELLPKVARFLYADPSDANVDMLSSMWSKATGQDVSQLASQLKMMPPEQRRQFAVSLDQKAMEYKTFQKGNTVASFATDPNTGEMKPRGSYTFPETEEDRARIEYYRRKGKSPDLPTAPSGYQWNDDGSSMMPIPGGPHDPESPVNMKKSAPKPLPASSAKLQNEELTAIGTFAGIDADLAGIEEQIDGGKLDFGLITNIANTGRNLVGASTQESRNLASFKAKIENLRNSVLLLNKGVQTEGDAQRAMNEIMSNLNDKELVRQRLKEIRGLNRRAVELRKHNVDSLRATYGQDEFDFSKYENQPPTTNLEPSSSHGAKPTAPTKAGGAQGGPMVGHEEGGYRFKGGNPSDPKNWEKI